MEIAGTKVDTAQPQLVAVFIAGQTENALAETV